MFGKKKDKGTNYVFDTPEEAAAFVDMMNDGDHLVGYNTTHGTKKIVVWSMRKKKSEPAKAPKLDVDYPTSTGSSSRGAKGIKGRSPEEAARDSPDYSGYFTGWSRNLSSRKG